MKAMKEVKLKAKKGMKKMAVMKTPMKGKPRTMKECFKQMHIENRRQARKAEKEKKAVAAQKAEKAVKKMAAMKRRGKAI